MQWTLEQQKIDAAVAQQQLDAARSQLVVVQPGALPNRAEGVNVALYAQQATNAVGERVYRPRGRRARRRRRQLRPLPRRRRRAARLPRRRRPAGRPPRPRPRRRRLRLPVRPRRPTARSTERSDAAPAGSRRASAARTLAGVTAATLGRALDARAPARSRRSSQRRAPPAVRRKNRSPTAKIAAAGQRRRSASRLGGARPLGVQHPVHLGRARRRRPAARPQAAAKARASARRHSKHGRCPAASAVASSRKKSLAVAVAPDLAVPAAETRQAGDPRPAAPARRPERAVRPGAAARRGCPSASRAPRRRAGCRRGRSGSGAATVATCRPIMRMEIARPVQPELRPAPRRARARSSSCCTTPRCRRAEAALDRLCDPAAEVSAHYLIAEDGRVWRLVDEAERAWHAGAGRLGRARRHQLALDRHRARQRRPARRLPAVPRAADGRARDACSTASCARWGIPPRRGHRPLRHGARAQGRPRPEVRLAPARARRPGALGRRPRRPGRGRLAGLRGRGRGRRLRGARRRLAGACSPRCGCAGGPGRARRRPRRPTSRRSALAACVDRGAAFPRKGACARMAGRPRPARVEESPDSRERWRRVTPARGDPRESATEKRPPGGLGRRARVKRWGKSPPRRRQRRRHGKPRQEQGQIGIARGPGPRVSPARAVRVGCTSPSATAGPEEWPSAT